MHTGTCETCHGTGVVTEQRARWIGGTKTGYRSDHSIEVRCETCDGTGDLTPIDCVVCGERVAFDETYPTIDDSGRICEDCFENEQAEILAGAPELAWLKSPFELMRKPNELEAAYLGRPVETFAHVCVLRCSDGDLAISFLYRPSASAPWELVDLLVIEQHALARCVVCGETWARGTMTSDAVGLVCGPCRWGARSA